MTSGERKTNKEKEPPRKVVRDFFLLRRNEWVDYSQQEEILNSYYKNYLGKKLETLMAPTESGVYQPFKS